jgi:CRISPR-associated endonuclease/helicase Cas3
VSLPDFPTYFRALWSRDPFPWQAMLAQRVARGDWPQALDLPTASGKTACIDIAVYTLAAQADRPLAERTASRRIWFVVDRRIVVDEAFERASKIAEKLARATGGPLKEVADRLRVLSGTERPLAVGRLRGGILRDDGWARIPSQPAIITSTVDQVGSRLLFRGYGHSLLAAPIFAGLAANDSLIVLDEAHCAVPFMQTLEAVARYRSPAWAEEPIATPFAFVVMSATPPQGLPPEAVFPGAERATALNHPELRRRLEASKAAELVTVKRRRSGEDDPLVAEAAGRAAAFLCDGRRRVAVMVNRVRTAMELAARLQDVVGDEADVVLLTGRIRPFERDGVVERWTPVLRAAEPEEPTRPIVVVTTQCLEVGADFSFDALVTECASLDALRQRFGRLARFGSDDPAPAVIVVREDDLEPKEPDPVYGGALSDTWQWLEGQATRHPDGRLVIDMGVAALQARVDALEDVTPLLAPGSNAPVLLPAHLDLFCQTAPPPHPKPDVSLYLHGRLGPPEVAVVWRCDLPEDNAGTWVETVALCPPVSGEMLQAPLWRVRAWLAQRAAEDQSADVEGAGAEPEEPSGRIRPCLVWRGRDRSKVARNAREIAPGDVVVVPASYGVEGLGQATRVEAVGEAGLDLWEAARAAAGQPPAVRLSPAVLKPWLDCPPVKALVVAATDPALDRDAIREAIQAFLDYGQPDEETPPPPPRWLMDRLREADSGRILEHPSGGVILVGRAARRRGAEPDLFADDDDLASAADREVALEEHSQLVRRAAERIAERCLPQDLGEALCLAAFWHDAGKLDPRFQLMLRQGDDVAAAAAEVPIAKSATVPASPARRQAIREASGLPENFRHEMLSMQLAHRFAELPQDEGLADLALHLIASHHGHGRPFAPVCLDRSPPDVHGVLGGTELVLHSTDRSASPPPHRLDSGIVERFWRLNRRYGWWGLAYLEALLRLADWYASNFALAERGDA